MKQTSINISSAQSLNSEPSQTFIPNKNKPKNGVDLIKNYLLQKAENLYKLNFSDEEAFKWKFHKNKNNRPLSSFSLIKKQQPVDTPIITLEDLRDFRFPVLAFKTKQLATFAAMILRENQYFKQQFNDEIFLQKIVTQISINYNIVSYHNFSHGFSLSLMLYQCFEYHKELTTLYSQEEQFYAILAGLAHDLNHPGTNNAFEIKIKSTRAREFNNESVLQNFHLKQLWKLLEKNGEINFLQKVSNPQEVKKYITSLILMTDVAQHMKNLQKLKALNVQAQQQKVSMLSKAQNREFFMGQLFHACDIGNPCIDFESYISWAALLSYEFNQQTVLEKENDVEVTEMLRYKDLTTFYKGQAGFINYMVFPLWKEIVVSCSGLAVFTENVAENLKILGQKIESASKEDENAEVVDF